MRRRGIVVDASRPCHRIRSGLAMIGLAIPLLVAFAGCEGQPDTQTTQRPSGPKPHLVELATVRSDTMRLTSVYTGSLRNRHTVRVFTQEEGRVTRLPYYEGDTAIEGDIILELDDRLLQAQLDKSLAVRREAEVSLERFQRLKKQSLVTEDEFLRAETVLEVAKAEARILRTRLSYTRVKAPFSSIVAARLAEPGDIVQRHTHVLTLVNPSSLITELDVSELLMPHIAVGDKVTVYIDALGDEQFSGLVLRIHPELDARTRQGRIEIELKPVPAAARAGQFARVTFSVEALNRKVIPFSALRRDRDGESVYRIDDTQTAHRVAVRSGERLADRVEVVEGLNTGDRVVVKGFLGLIDGTQVTPVGESAADTTTVGANTPLSE
ncbi:MAG: efflux RND transporter periplasmic adaptor subunit [Gammaproteobacteria bacterium]|nr:efflux RND transporter periplasmic adaptor subunit [Gammaproteobacteria bacterium]